MKTKHESLKTNGGALVGLGILLLIIGAAMFGSDGMPVGIITTLLYLGQALLLGGIVLLGLAVVVRHDEPAPVQQPQGYYPPQQQG